MIVALSASYGAGGSRVGPALAKRLGVPFLDRAIPFAVSERLDVDIHVVDEHDERVGGSRLERIMRGFIGQNVGAPVPLASEMTIDEDFRRATEEVLMNMASTGQGVILGRAATIVLRDRPAVLRARLDGPPDRRAAQAARIGNLELRETGDRVKRFDRAQGDYWRRFYSADIRDPALYDIVLDSTRLDLEECVGLLETAALALIH